MKNTTQRPRVLEDHYLPGTKKVTLEQMMVITNAIADGLNWEKPYSESVDCIYGFLDLSLRLQHAVDDIGNVTDPTGKETQLFPNVINKTEIYEFLLAVGNISSEYKACFVESEANIFLGIQWASQFPDGGTYGLHLIPNLLSQAVILNKYVERMALYEKHNDEAGIAYLWALMFRKIFLFDLPPVDEELEDMIRESNLRKAEQEGYYNWTIANEGRMIIPSNRNQRRIVQSSRLDSNYISKVWMRYYLNSVEPRLSNMWLKFHQLGLWTYKPPIENPR